MEFFNKYFSPASSERARLSIHLRAQGTAEGAQQRQEEAQKKADEESTSSQKEDKTCNGISAVASAEEITDVRVFKASLTASSGARPAKDLSEYEDTDAKL